MVALNAGVRKPAVKPYAAQKNDAENDKGA